MDGRFYSRVRGQLVCHYQAAAIDDLEVTLELRSFSDHCTTYDSSNLSLEL